SPGRSFRAGPTRTGWIVMATARAIRAGYSARAPPAARAGGASVDCQRAAYETGRSKQAPGGEGGDESGAPPATESPKLRRRTAGRCDPRARLQEAAAPGTNPAPREGW